MRTLADVLEAHLRSLVDRGDGSTQVQRCELAVQFACAPSQVSYVLQRRFTLEHGYVVETRRGGGGYIRIHRMRRADVIRYLRGLGDAEDHISQEQGCDLIADLRDAGLVTVREAAMLVAVTDRACLRVALPERDHLRARILNAAVACLIARPGRSDSDVV